MSPQLPSVAIITVLPESGLRLTKDIFLGDRALLSEPFIADAVLAQTTFRKSCFGIKRFELLQYHHYQYRHGTKTLSYGTFLGSGWWIISTLGSLLPKITLGWSIKWKKSFWSLAVISRDLGQMLLFWVGRPMHRCRLDQRSTALTLASAFDLHLSTLTGQCYTMGLKGR
jgi:hypothetical protein